MTVTLGTDATTTIREIVTITTPENNSEIPTDSINITGSAKKNSKIQIMLNGKQVGESQTSEDGTFIFELKKIDQELNILQVQILDGTDKVVGISEKVSFKTSTGGPVFNRLTIKEGKKVSIGTLLNIEITADPKLKEVSVTLGDSTSVFRESKEGIYTGTLTTPSATGSYGIDVILKNDIGKITVKSSAETIEAIELPNLFKNIKSELVAKKVIFTFNLDTEPVDLAKFKFQYGTESGTLTKGAITLDKEKIKNNSGAYTWYIQDLDPQTKYFRILGLDKAGKELSRMRASDVFEVNLALEAPTKCMVSNIANLKTTAGDGTTILSWDPAQDASSGYNVYKKGSDGKYVLIENVPTNTYTINIAKDAVKYDDFAVK